VGIFSSAIRRKADYKLGFGHTRSVRSNL